MGFKELLKGQTDWHITINENFASIANLKLVQLWEGTATPPTETGPLAINLNQTGKYDPDFREFVAVFGDTYIRGTRGASAGNLTFGGGGTGQNSISVKSLLLTGFSGTSYTQARGFARHITTANAISTPSTPQALTAIYAVVV